MKNTLLLLFSLLCVMDADAADQAGGRLTTDQGRMLVLASLTAQQGRLPSRGADPYNDPHSKFLLYTVTWAGTPNGSVVVGNYAVDPRTGDVFSATTACDEMKNAKLAALQRKVHSKLQCANMSWHLRSIERRLPRFSGQVLSLTYDTHSVS
jgi:hypothetical protein